MKKKKRKQAKALAELMRDRPEIRALLDDAATSSPARVQRMMAVPHDGQVGVREVLQRATLALKVAQAEVMRLRIELAERDRSVDPAAYSS